MIVLAILGSSCRRDPLKSKYIFSTYIEISRERMDMFGMYVDPAGVWSRHGDQ